MAFGHLVFSWLIGRTKELSTKVSLLRYEWFFLLFGALFPDGDFFLEWIFGWRAHREFTHSLFMVVVGFLIVYLGSYLVNKKFEKNINGRKLGFYFGLGILSHLIADAAFGYPGVSLLWPLDYRFWFFGFATNYINTTLGDMSKEDLIKYVKFAIFDMGVGVLWLGYLFFKKKIKGF